MKKSAFLSLLLLVATLAAVAQEQTPAFPGAEGFGRYVTGGRGGTVYHVKNLNDAGYQSLRWSLAQNPGKPKIIVFDVSGTIHLESALSITSNITIINTSYWSSGTYIWTVVVDGKVVESGKWIKE